MERFDLVIDFVQFSFTHIPDELVQGQALSPAILLASTPDILSESGVSIIDVGHLSGYGFKISGGKLEIAGTPNTAFDCQEHKVTINCPGLLSDVSLKLLLPRVEIWKLPRLAEKAVMQITSFGLNKKIAEVKASAETHKYGFEEQCMGSGTPVPKGKDGWYELTMMFEIETKATLEYVDGNLSGLEEVKVEGFGSNKDADIKIYVKDGHLVIKGTPRAHASDRDLLIDTSQKRFRHHIVTITPQNQGGDGEKVNLLTTCRPLKEILCVAQTCNFEAMPTTIEKLECCKLDLETLIDDHRLLGIDILMWFLDTTRAVIEKARKDFTSFTGEVKTADIVYYLSGHGYENGDGSQSHLLVVDKDGSADWEIDSGNVCIQTELAAIAEAADNSTFAVLIIDACRTQPSGTSTNKRSDQAFKPVMPQYFKQQVVWWATSSERIARGGERGEMSLFSKSLHDMLSKVITGELSELM